MIGTLTPATVPPTNNPDKLTTVSYIYPATPVPVATAILHYFGVDTHTFYPAGNICEGLRGGLVVAGGCGSTCSYSHNIRIRSTTLGASAGTVYRPVLASIVASISGQSRGVHLFVHAVSVLLS